MTTLTWQERAEQKQRRISKAQDQAYEVKKAVMTSLKDDFNAAAETAVAKALAVTEETLRTGKYPASVYRDGYNLESARRRIWELQQGVEGDYRIWSSYLGIRSGMELWGHYLESIDRFSRQAYGGAVINEETVAELIMQNGPKKMEQRLRSFAKQQIKRVVTRATYDIAPRPPIKVKMR